jgi:hypothetical protein
MSWKLFYTKDASKREDYQRCDLGHVMNKKGERVGFLLPASMSDTCSTQRIASN